MEFELQLLHSHAAARGGTHSEPSLSSPTTDGTSTASNSSDGDLNSSRDSSDLHIVSDDEPAPEATEESLSSSRLVLIIDDAHLADSHSCEVLTRLARSLPSQMIMLLACREPRVSLGKPLNAADDEEAQFSPGHRLVHKLSAMKDAAASVCLRPVSAAVADQLACAELGVSAIPAEASTIITRRSGGSPLLCQAIARNLVYRGALRIDEDGSGGTLVPGWSERLLNAAATEALIESCHSVICVKIAELSLMQQLVLKAMSLLPTPCSQSLIMHAMPLQISTSVLTGQLRALRERYLITTPQSHRRSLPTAIPSAFVAGSNESKYQFVDVGMREVCQHLMVESQKRQIRLRIAAVNESKHVLGSLADSMVSSADSDDGSPSMLRASKLQHLGRPAPVRTENESSSAGEDASVRGSSISLDGDAHWWLSRSPASAVSSPDSPSLSMKSSRRGRLSSGSRDGSPRGRSPPRSPSFRKKMSPLNHSATALATGRSRREPFPQSTALAADPRQHPVLSSGKWKGKAHEHSATAPASKKPGHRLVRPISVRVAVGWLFRRRSRTAVRPAVPPRKTCTHCESQRTTEGDDSGVSARLSRSSSDTLTLPSTPDSIQALSPAQEGYPKSHFSPTPAQGSSTTVGSFTLPESCTEQHQPTPALARSLDGGITAAPGSSATLTTMVGSHRARRPVARKLFDWPSEA
jgi:hypothetical protein